MESDRNCHICSGDFNLETEGGVTGFIGILPVSICPTCFAGVSDLVTQRCDRCIEADEAELRELVFGDHKIDWDAVRRLPQETLNRFLIELFMVADPTVHDDGTSKFEYLRDFYVKETPDAG